MWLVYLGTDSTCSLRLLSREAYLRRCGGRFSYRLLAVYRRLEGVLNRRACGAGGICAATERRGRPSEAFVPFWRSSRSRSEHDDRWLLERRRSVRPFGL